MSSHEHPACGAHPLVTRWSPSQAPESSLLQGKSGPRSVSRGLVNPDEAIGGLEPRPAWTCGGGSPPR